MGTHDHITFKYGWRLVKSIFIKKGKRKKQSDNRVRIDKETEKQQERPLFPITPLDLTLWSGKRAKLSCTKYCS